MFEELWKFIQAHYAAKRYHLVLSNIQLLIPLFNQSLFNNPPYVQSVLESLQEIFIQVDALAHEFYFREYLHKYYIEPLYQQLIKLDANLAQTFKNHLYQHIPPNSFTSNSSKAYKHKFEKFYDVSVLKTKAEIKALDGKSDKPAKEADEALLTKRTDLIALYESNAEQNLHAVWNELILSYVDAQIRDIQILTSDQLFSVLDLLEDSLVQVVKATRASAKSLWHQIFIAHRLLCDKWIIDHFFLEKELGELIDWWQRHSGHAAGMFLLSALARFIALSSAEDSIARYEFVKHINTALLTTAQTKSLLLKDHRPLLKEMRSVFSDLQQNQNLHPQMLIQAQKEFTQQSLALLKLFVEQTAKLLGDAPCDFALCALGSTSREDRRPYSDVELLLIYSPKEHAKPGQLHTYLFYLIVGVELAIKHLGETHYESLGLRIQSNSDQCAGFHIDSSSHVLINRLVGTPEEIANKKFIVMINQYWEKKVKHSWLEDESFYSLLSPVVINSDSHGSEQVFAAYQQRIQTYLNNDVAEEDQPKVLAQSLNVASPTYFKNLKRREAIALTCLIDVVRKSKALLSTLKATEIINIKDAFYKPLTYLALNLKLFYGLTAKHPAEIFAEAASKVSWGERQIIQLLQTALSYITQIQVDLHITCEHQEERIIWLNNDNQNNAQVTGLNEQAYVGLSLIKGGLLDLLRSVANKVSLRQGIERRNL